MELYQFQNSVFEFAMQNAIQNSEHECVNPNMPFHEVRIQSMNAESICGSQNCS